MRRKNWLPLLSLVLGACTPAGKPEHADLSEARAPEVADIKETTFRFLMRNAVRESRVKFVDYGDKTHMDPPKDFLPRLFNLGVELKPVSLAAFPLPGAMDPADSRRFLGVTDRATGKEAIVYAACIETWVDANHVKVSASVYAGPLRDGGAVDLMLTKTDGKWTIESFGDLSTN